MKEINLTQGKVTPVDDEDFDYLNQFNWYAIRCKKIWYACRHGKRPFRSLILLHRIIMKVPPNLQVDHIDHDGLNNQKHNLRICTETENRRNTTTKSKYGYRGVNKSDGKYIYARIYVNGKSKYLGKHSTLKDAAIAYDRAAKKYFGEFANLNFKD